MYEMYLLVNTRLRKLAYSLAEGGFASWSQVKIRRIRVIIDGFVVEAAFPYAPSCRGRYPFTVNETSGRLREIADILVVHGLTS